MKFRDHSFRRNPPDYNIVIQMTYAEADRLLDDVRSAYFGLVGDNNALYQLGQILIKERMTRKDRKPNPGWIGAEDSPLSDNYRIPMEERIA